MKNANPVKTMILAVSLLLQLSAFCFNSRGAAGDVDLSFDPGSAVDGTVNAITLQPDGKVLIAGQFTTISGLERTDLARLNADGSGDSSFNAGTVIGEDVSSVALQSDGKVLVATPAGIFRLNSDGSYVGAFNLSPAGGDYAVATTLAVQSDNKVLAGGYSVTVTVDPEGYNNYSFSYFLIRFNADGTHDTSFFDQIWGSSTWYFPWIESIAVQSDGKVLFAGSFGIGRLNANGTGGSGFTATGWSFISALALQADGKLLIDGNFTINGTNKYGVSRLNADGSVDNSFNPATFANGNVSSIILQPDGKVLIGGYFTGTARNGIARLNANGSLDNSFNPGTGANDTVRSIALQSDGKVLIGGAFTTVNGLSRPHLARFYGDAVIIPSLNIARSNTFAIVSWPTNATSYSLQENTNLSLPISWFPGAQATATNAGQISVAIPTGVGPKFFRLESQ